MKVVLQTPNQLVVHEGVLKTVVVGTIFIAVGGGLITLRLTTPSGWSGNAGPWLIYLVGGVCVVVGLAALMLSADRRFVFDRSAGTVQITVQRLAHRTTDQYALGDLKDVALERSLGLDTLEIDPGADIRGGARVTIGNEIAPGLVARFSRQFGEAQ